MPTVWKELPAEQRAAANLEAMKCCPYKQVAALMAAVDEVGLHTYHPHLHSHAVVSTTSLHLLPVHRLAAHQAAASRLLQALHLALAATPALWTLCNSTAVRLPATWHACNF